MPQNMDQTIQKVIDDIITDACRDHSMLSLSVRLQPSKEAVIEVLDALQTILFPANFKRAPKMSEFAVKYELGMLLEQVYTTLTDQITVALLSAPEYEGSDKAVRRSAAENIAAAFIEKLPAIRSLLKKDAQAGFDGDPAAFSKDEIINTYPGFYAILVNRAAHELHLAGVPVIPRMMTEYAHSVTGADIHPGAQIGEYFFIDHATGVVIGETTVIGDHVKLYQGVTLGGLSTRGGQALRGSKRHPTIGSNVTIYSGASILGGETVIGEGCLIGGNSFITHSIPPYTRVSIRAPELQIKPSPAPGSNYEI